ncbi:MAG TPA: hypothetical protein VIF88_08865 [Methylocystis sp.]
MCDLSHRGGDWNMRCAFGLIDPAGAVQARQFAPVKVGPVLRRVDLQSRLGE